MRISVFKENKCFTGRRVIAAKLVRPSGVTIFIFGFNFDSECDNGSRNANGTLVYFMIIWKGY